MRKSKFLSDVSTAENIIKTANTRANRRVPLKKARQPESGSDVMNSAFRKDSTSVDSLERLNSVIAASDHKSNKLAILKPNQR